MKRNALAVAVLVGSLATPAALVLAPAVNAGTVPRCATSELSLSHTRHDVGAGNGVEWLVFTNTGSKTCALQGFPGVSYVARSGRQLGAAADREGSSYAAVVLRPTEGAHARLHFINNVSAVPHCYHAGQQHEAVGLRVYPPDSTLAMYVRDPHPACNSLKVHLLHIEAVRPA
jgi:hypothetical protein